jgi:hypothetical protein
VKAPVKTGEVQWMRESYDKGGAKKTPHKGPLTRIALNYKFFKMKKARKE